MGGGPFSGLRIGRTILILAACVSLGVGFLVYIADRAATPVLLVPTSFLLSTGPLFGRMGDWLPSFIHPFAFSLLTAAACEPGARPAYAACVGWWLVNVAFEIGQHPALSGPIANALHGVFGHSAPVKALSGYFVHGTFDGGDLIAATAGALAAARLLWHVHQMEKRYAV